MTKAFFFFFFYALSVNAVNQNLDDTNVKISQVIELFEKEFKNDISELEIGKIKVITGSSGNYVDMDWDSKEWTVYLSASQNTVITDSYLLLICHEYGHIISNSKENLSNGIPSDEAIADFWAAQECAPRIWKLFSPLDSNVLISPKQLYQIEDFCKAAEDDAETCIRTSKAAFEWRFMSPEDLDFSERYYPLQIDQENLSCTPKIDGRYPLDTQCSFNTLLAGASGQSRPTCWNLIMSGIRLNSDGSHIYTDIDDILKCPAN